MTLLSSILQRHLRAGDTYLDAGAQNGVGSALIAASIVGPDGLVLALEPEAAAFERLSRNAKRSELTNLHCFKMALSDRSRAGAEPQRRIDDLMRVTGVRKIDFVRINTPEHAEEIIRGMGELVSQHDAPGVLLSRADALDTATRHRVEDLLHAADYDLSMKHSVLVALSPALRQRRFSSDRSISRHFFGWCRAGGGSAPVMSTA
jgi:precorrin-6B methylase 2